MNFRFHLYPRRALCTAANWWASLLFAVQLANSLAFKLPASCSAEALTIVSHADLARSLKLFHTHHAVRQKPYGDSIQTGATAHSGSGHTLI